MSIPPRSSADEGSAKSKIRKTVRKVPGKEPARRGRPRKARPEDTAGETGPAQQQLDIGPVVAEQERQAPAPGPVERRDSSHDRDRGFSASPPAAPAAEAA